MTWTPPSVVGNWVDPAGAVWIVPGPMATPKSVMISPAEMPPVLKLAALVTRLMVGSGAVTVRLTETVVEPVAPPEPAMTIVPV